MKFLTLGLCLFVLSFAGRVDAATITVNAGGDLQAAINAAKPGDTILLQAGAVFTGNYDLPVKGGTSYITIRSSAPDTALPPDGTRITPAYTASMAKLRSDQFGPALRTVGPAAYWRVMFVEFMPSISTAAANLVELGAAGAAQHARRGAASSDHRSLLPARQSCLRATSRHRARTAVETQMHQLRYSRTSRGRATPRRLPDGTDPVRI